MARLGIPDVESIQESSALEKMCAVPSTENKSTWSRWRRKLFGIESHENTANPADDDDGRLPGFSRRIGRKVVPGLPRPGTFKRQQSELRDNLEPTKPNSDERRTVSVDRRRTCHPRSTSASHSAPRISAPDVLMGAVHVADENKEIKETIIDEGLEPAEFLEVPEPEPEVDATSDRDDAESISTASISDTIRLELEKRWILNLSMHFRDKSNREKFFVTYAEEANHWRRVTISLDYREAEPQSLEYDLQHTRFQRDKSAKIYKSICESLQDIQFFETVTNLKLQTESDRLHVHVTEDVHEIISYPPITAIQHLECRQVREEELSFDSHLSGFVYKVTVGEEVFIKKEIPGPDTVEEFLYEINALKQLSGSACVIQFGGVIVDNEVKMIKGLLISYAEQGALVDILYDRKGELPWYRRQRWAKQIVQGLSEIHEAGFVQGDFTLSNIVIDGDDNAKIIDINRRGCPVGWEPPEVAALISSSQRISMYIGVKSDLFQLGMVLWAIAMEQDEPETHPRPLTISSSSSDVPAYYREIVATCLSHNPRNRLQASAILNMFPFIHETTGPTYTESVTSLPRSMEEYIDPAYAVNRTDIDNFRGTEVYPNESGKNDRSTHTYVEAEDEPYFYPKRGRSLSPRPVNGHSPSPQPFSAESPSVGNTFENTQRSPSRSIGDPTENNFNRHIRIVSPPSPPPTAEKWMDPSPAYSESEKLLHTHFFDLDNPPPQPQTHNIVEYPRETVAEQQDQSPNPAFSKSSCATTDHCADLAGVGAHHDITTSLIQSNTGADTVTEDIFSDLERLDIRGEDSHMPSNLGVGERTGSDLHIDNDNDEFITNKTKTTLTTMGGEPDE